MDTPYTQLKVQSRCNLDNYRSTGNSFYLNRAINQTRLAISLLRASTPLPHDGRTPFVSYVALEH